MSDDTPALERLEQLVTRAGERLRELRSENAELRERVATLEREAEDRAGDADTAAALVSEKDELIQRVEQLVAGLDDLLSVAES
jgi:DNA repair exonuclease SbcCD ATPase subunit